MFILYMTCKTSLLLEIDQGSGRAFLNGEKVEMKHLHSAIKTQLRPSSTLSQIVSHATHATHALKLCDCQRGESLSLSNLPPCLFSLFELPSKLCRTSERIDT